MLIISFVVAVIGVMFIILYKLNGINEQFVLSIIPSVIVEMIGILITYYFISYLLLKSEEKKTKAKAFNITGNRYKGLVYDIGTKFIHLITRKPFGHKNNQHQELKEQINEIISNLEQLVPADFMYKGIEMNFIVPKPNGYSSETKLIEYQKFCKWAKEENQKVFEKFITRYIGFLPDDLRESLLNVETILQRILVTPMDFGLDIGFQVNQEEHLRDLKELGEELIFLLEYFDEFENN